MGLFQVMPYWFSGKPKGLEDLEGANPYSPENSVRAASTHLASCYNWYGDWGFFTFGCYNRWRGWEKDSTHNIPTETKNYAFWGSQIYSDTLGNGNKYFNEYHAHKKDYCDRANRRLGG